MYFCTYFDFNYLQKGNACYKTLLQLDKDLVFYIVCLDKKTQDVVSLWPKTKIITLEDLENYYPVLLNAKNNRLPKEYYATLSPILPLYIFEKYEKVDILFYTDADIAFWSDPHEMINVIENKSLMVTDHGFEPPRDGVRFNVGILGYRNDKYCKSFLEWWRDKCIEWCKWTTLADGKCADQGYLNILHENHNIYNSLSCPHPGINMGPWNISKHLIHENNGKKIVDLQYNLICYHYHEFKIIGNSYYPTGWKHTLNDRKIIYEPYFKLIMESR